MVLLAKAKLSALFKIKS